MKECQWPRDSFGVVERIGKVYRFSTGLRDTHMFAHLSMMIV